MLSKVRSYRESVSKIQSDIRKRQMEISKDRFSSGARRLDDEEEGESTGKSLSEALIFASTNPQYDDTHHSKILKDGWGKIHSQSCF